MKFEESLAFGRIKNYAVSAIIACIITASGIILGGYFLFGFGIFMLFLIGLLTAVAVTEYIISLA